MTAYDDLIIELRSGEDGLEYAAADALWEQARQITDLEAELQVSLHVNDQLRARVAELEAHLDRCSAWMETYGEDGHEPQLFQEIIRQARAALGEKE